ncbi:hypothetical protein F0267_00500 [Vibrio coralliilyticus]|uniref:Uncharacterized protein n=1 Tax=Vibrio coralliilyticus TaxID=190893 RepID=A0AAN0SHG4_9VIBR|nr:hypothetical protein [Vibrio coralliilyticus]AIW22602.1 hypothetical protein IX92_26430 [Vibrio coralliilyticus]NOH36699.1 hypothetical protein [Vibrio coralliilyticus]
MKSISQQINQTLRYKDKTLLAFQMDASVIVEEACKVAYSKVTPAIMLHNIQNLESLAVNYCKQIFATEYPTWKEDYKIRLEQFNGMFKTAVCNSAMFYPLIFIAMAKEWFFANPEKLPPVGGRLLEKVDLDPQYWAIITAPLIPALHRLQERK